jgi:murein L,D-transpeptidase YcbB/YkuD
MRAACVLVVLVTAAACDAGDGGPRLLEERLRSLLAVGQPDPSPDEVREALAREVRTSSVPAPGRFPTRETLGALYAARGHRLVWLDESGRTLPRTMELLEALRRAGEHGLRAEDYAPDRLDALAARAAKSDEAGLADFDLLATALFLRYAADLATGRLHPDEVQGAWHTNPPEIDFVAAFGKALEEDGLERFLEALPPPHAGYARLRDALKDLREIAAAGGWPALAEGPTLDPGSRGPAIVVLRERLAFEPAEPPAGDSDLFDPRLEESVRRFQERHGIEPDGRVGGQTLAELNVPVEARIEQVELNLERWRWIPRRLQDPHVLVNIPGFDLALVRGEEAVWRTRVVIGKSYTPTPVFSDRIVAIVVNPPWNVPDSIARGEYLPELREDPRALERHGLRLLEGWDEDARELDPTAIDWKKVDAEHFPYRMRQDPGPDNALGRLKFELTNEFHVYLHDTPAGHLFGRTERDLSHGCIRVENVTDLASRIAGSSGERALREALDQPEERRLPVDPPVATHILYWTAWVDEAGLLRFGPDVYGVDRAQKAAHRR